METDRRKEVVKACLDTFVSKGLAYTTSRDLSEAMKLKSGGLYYYFTSKDEAVVACAEEAVFQLESKLINPALKEVDDTDKMLAKFRERATQMAPTMRFLFQVFSTLRYSEKLTSALNRLCKRYRKYSEQFAQKFNCDVDEIELYVYLCITAVSNYMIFVEDAYILPQMKLVRNEINKLKNNIDA